MANIGSLSLVISALLYVQVAEGPSADRTTDFAELKRQLDVADADIVLVNKRLDEAHGMYVGLVSKCLRGA